MSRPDLRPILVALRLARDEAERAYQETPDGWDRVALSGVVDDLAAPIAHLKELVYGPGGAE
jgi:hypothetical protein